MKYVVYYRCWFGGRWGYTHSVLRAMPFTSDKDYPSESHWLIPIHNKWEC